MRNFSILMRVQARAIVNSLMPGRRNRTSSGAGRLATVALSVIGLAGLAIFYLTMIASMLADAGISQALPALAVVAGSLAGVVFTLLKANGTLFGFTDYDLVMSLPIDRRTIVASRLVSLMGFACALAVICMTPLYAVYFAHVGIQPLPLIAAIISVLLAPVIPTSIAVFIAFALTALAARFRHANLVYIVLALLGLSGVVAFSWGAAFAGSASTTSEAVMIESAAQLARLMELGLEQFYPPAALVSSAVVHGQTIPLTGFVLISLVFGGVCLEVLQRFYLRINGLLTSRKRGKRMDAAAVARQNRARSPFWAIVVKELRTQIGISTYAINTLFGYLLAILLCVGMIAFDGQQLITERFMGSSSVADPGTAELATWMTGLLLPWFFAICGIGAPAAVPSVSLEGKSAWILASAPVSPRVALRAKLASNALPLAAITIVGACSLLAARQTTPLSALEIVVAGFGTFYLWVSLGLAIDARRPNFSWTSAQDVVKRGAPMLVAVMGGMLTVLACVALTVFSVVKIGIPATHILVLVLGACFGIAGELIFRWAARTVTRFEA